MILALGVLAIAAGFAAAMLPYLASPRQQWRAGGPLPTSLGLGLGAACALVSLLAALQLMAPMEAVFAWGVLLMLVWSIAPFLGLWRARRRSVEATS